MAASSTAVAAAPSVLRTFTQGGRLTSAGPLTAPTSNSRVLEQMRTIHPATYADLDRVRRCATCTLEYRERENIGTWRCWFHFGVFDAADTERWRCCGRRRHENGCRRCDHVERELGASALDRVATEVPEWASTWVTPSLSDAVANDRVSDAWVIWDIRSPADRRSEHEEQRYREWVTRRRRLIARGDYVVRLFHY
jgi:hypothetical protein